MVFLFLSHTLVLTFAEDNGFVHMALFTVISYLPLFIWFWYGTSKVGLAVGPALFIWFCSLGVIGIYNLIKYDSSVLKAFNPVHIYYFFKRNSTKGWYALGGCLLCATGKQGFRKLRSLGT
ncbi:hypothetical protein CsSME_00048971 [Camellia sinensis var. sinensis]